MLHMGTARGQVIDKVLELRITYRKIPLSYLCLQLHQNLWAKDFKNLATQAAPNFNRIPLSTNEALIARRQFESGKRISAVRDAKGTPPFLMWADSSVGRATGF